MNLVVYSGGKRAGVLDMAAGEPFYGFTYDRAYLASSDAAPLSVSLPLRGMGMRIGAHSNIDRVTADDLVLLAKSLGMSVARLSQMACELAEALPRSVDDAAALLQEKTPDETSELVERIRKGIEKRSSICLSL